MKKILVTGGAGHIGSCLAHALVRDEENLVVIIDDLSTGYMWKLPPKSMNIFSTPPSDKPLTLV